jgi:hypothetical protein
MRFRLALVKCLWQKIFYASQRESCCALWSGRVPGVVPAGCWLLAAPAGCWLHLLAAGCTCWLLAAC